jgi:hypothetical protein
MEALFAKDFMSLWAFVLALALFFPVRRLIWVLYVRRAERKEAMPDEAEQARLRRRAGFTAGLLCLVFSFLYVSSLFGGAP